MKKLFMTLVVAVTLGLTLALMMHTPQSWAQNQYGLQSAGPPTGCPSGPTFVFDVYNNVLYTCGIVNQSRGSVPVPAGDPWVSVLTSNTAQATAAGTSDQNLQVSTMGALGQFPMNVVGRNFSLNANGTYNLASAGAETFKVKLCTIPATNCSGGTAVTLATWVTASQATTGVTLAFDITLQCTTVAAGSAGTMECHGPLTFDSGATLAAASSTFLDSNTAVVAALPLNAQWFLVTSIAYGASNASNTSLVRQQVVQVNGPGIIN